MNDNSKISGNISAVSPNGMSGGLTTLMSMSGGLSNRSSQIDYEIIRQYIQNYIADLSYVEDIDIGDDGSVRLLKSDNI